MSKVVGSAPLADEDAEAKRALSGKKARTRKALELVAMRGRDVVGVRHLLAGGTAWIGTMGDAIARMPMSQYGGHPLIVGEVTPREFALYVPPRARARTQGGSELPRLHVGPHKIALADGERAVLVIGQVQIRAQIIDIDMFSSELGSSAGVAGWIAFVGAVYVAVLAVCAAIAPAPAARLDGGAMQRLHGQVVPRVAP